MRTVSVIAASDHLARIVGARPINGIAELIWNSFDADSEHVSVVMERSELGAIRRVILRDDGTGFDEAEVVQTFSQVGGSWKNRVSERKTARKRRLLHGNRGQGRWRAFSIGDKVRWESVSLDDRGIPHRTIVEMSSDKLDQCTWESVEAPGSESGTTVIIDVGMREPTELLGDSARSDLTAILALYLAQYPEIEVVFDEVPLDVDTLITTKVDLAVDAEAQFGSAEVTVIEWAMAVDRTLCLCDEHGVTLHETNAGIQAPGFDFTAYVKWGGFREYESLLPLAELDNREVGPTLAAAREVLRQYFRNRRTEQQETILEAWRTEDVYPYVEEPDDNLGQAEQALFNFIATTAAPAVNQITDPQAKRLSLAAMKVAVERDPTSIEYIFREVLQLPAEKIDELRELLEKTELTNLVDAMRMITGRLEFLAGLEILLFDPTNAPSVLERAHLHKLIEAQPWLFGEQFATHVSDQSLTALLNAHVTELGRADLTGAPVLDEEGRRRRVDFMFGRVLEFNTVRREHLVVEIKRPSSTIGRTEIDQITDYAMAVTGDGRFDLQEVEWDFILMATALDTRAESRLGQEDRHPSLIHDKAGVRIWVRRWAEVINECKHRLRFIRQQLNYDPTTDEAIQYLRDTYPDYLPTKLREDEI